MDIKDKKNEISTSVSGLDDKTSSNVVAPFAKEVNEVMLHKTPIPTKTESDKVVEVSTASSILKDDVDPSLEKDKKKLKKLKKSTKKMIAEKKQVEKTAKKVGELKEKLKKAKKKDAKKSVIKKVKGKLSDSKKTLKTKKAKLKKALKK